ncbi:MAG: hypothetical protein IJM30_06460 [Thermoguttaceae bacterium]|nr:hypothetical protein [Thermoguttaceae bacterium]
MLTSCALDVESSRRETRESRFVDLGIPQWETSWNRPSLSGRFFETFLARPRGSACPFSFILKALREEYRGTELGFALIERERAVGSLDCRRLLPIVDIGRSKTRSSRALARDFLVFPRFQGRTLASILKSRKRPTLCFVEGLKRRCREIAEAARSCGWTFDKLSASQILVANDAITATDPNDVNAILIDYSSLFRFGEPSLLTSAFDPDRDFSPTFDSRFKLAPDAITRRDLDSTSAERAIQRLLKQVVAKLR